MPTREELHRLVDEIPETETGSARRFLEFLRSSSDPVLRSFMEAPEDDEPESEEERLAVAEAYEDIAHGRVVTAEEIEKELS